MLTVVVAVVLPCPLYLGPSFQGHNNNVTHLDWGKDGRFLQSVSADYDLLYCKCNVNLSVQWTLLSATLVGLPAAIAYYSRIYLNYTEILSELKRLKPHKNTP